MAVRLYGIPNCDTVKKARAYLESHDIAYDFIDFKKQGVDHNALQGWIDQHGLETVINRRGTTWRKLSDAEKESAEHIDGAIVLATENPSLIKRPVLEAEGQTLVGFKEDDYASFI